MADKDAVVEIALTQGKVAIVDLADWEAIPMLHRQWHLLRNGRNFYAQREERDESGRLRCFLMHRLIMGTPPGMRTDHRDLNGLNNRRSNLRICTNGQNRANTVPRLGRRFKGTRRAPREKRWQAMITVNGIRHLLGGFATEEEAAAAYNEAARQLHGEFARLNVIPTQREKT